MKRLWKIGVALALFGLLAVAGVACSTSQTGTPTQAPAPQAAKNLILSSDIVTGSGGTVKAAASCVLTSQYKRGNQVVFRVRAYDPQTGKQMDDKALSAVTITLPDGQTFNGKYSGHPATDPNADHFWATSWVIPDSYPTGTLTYTATAKAVDGRTGTYDNFRVQTSLLTVVQ